MNTSLFSTPSRISSLGDVNSGALAFAHPLFILHHSERGVANGGRASCGEGAPYARRSNRVWLCCQPTVLIGQLKRFKRQVQLWCGDDLSACFHGQSVPRSASSVTVCQAATLDRANFGAGVLA